jgi:hypothetical protein
VIVTYWHSLHEGFARRVALVLIGLGILTGVAINLVVKVGVLPDGLSRIMLGTRTLGRAATAVPAVLSEQFGVAGGIWILVALFAAAPLLASTLDRGWLELTFSTATPRWRIFVGRYLASVTLYSVTFLLATVPLAARLWWTTGIGTWQIAVAMLLETLSFAALLSVAALATLPQKGVALPIMAAVVVWLFSPFLAHRESMFNQLFTSHAAHAALDCVYRILPKCSELDGLCSTYIIDGGIASWWPVWSTAVFTLAVLAVTLWQLERKSF